MTVQEWIEAIANLQAIAQTGLQYGKDAYDGEPVLFLWRTALNMAGEKCTREQVLLCFAFHDSPDQLTQFD